MTAPLSHTGTVCVRFAYHMFGEHMGDLTLFIEDKATRNRLEVWAMKGEQSTMWISQQTQLELNSLNARVIITITVFQVIPIKHILTLFTGR